MPTTTPHAILTTAKGTIPTLPAPAALPSDCWLPPVHPDARAALVHAMAQMFVEAFDAVSR